MSWRTFGQIALLILLYFALDWASLLMREARADAAYQARLAAARTEAARARLESTRETERIARAEREIAAARAAAESRYDPPPADDDPNVSIMNGVPFRADGHYRPGSPEARAQAAARTERGRGD
ncbi:MAG TPA: hypothetical protein VGX37_02995 [Allosphingosinicella sp.]|jgi:hypothetical protein|nr:hypothetical protein [Allosphingosinicella sp.]